MRIRRALAIAGTVLGTVLIAGTAQAGVVTLTFEGLQDQEQILNFYNGGTGSDGSSGPDYGVAFGDSALALIDSDAGGTGNFSNEPSPDTIAFFLSGGNLVMNVASGFDTGFSFYYTSAVVGSVTIYDGLDGSGNVLGTIPLAAQYDQGCTSTATDAFCNWTATGIAFSGTAKSVSFAGTENGTGFDDLTLGSATPPTPVPVPAALPIIAAALGGFGYAGWRKSKSA